MNNQIKDWRTVFLVENQNSIRANIISLTNDPTLIYKRRLADLLNSSFNSTDDKFLILRNERYGLEEREGETLVQMMKINPQLNFNNTLFGFEVDVEDLYVGNNQKKNEFRSKINLHYELDLQVGPFRIRGHTYNFEEKLRDFINCDKFISIHNSQIVYSTPQGQPFLDFYRIFLNSNLEKNIFGVNSKYIDINTIEIHKVTTVTPNDHPIDLSQSQKNDDNSWDIGPKKEKK